MKQAGDRAHRGALVWGFLMALSIHQRRPKEDLVQLLGNPSFLIGTPCYDRLSWIHQRFQVGLVNSIAVEESRTGI